MLIINEIAAMATPNPIFCARESRELKNNNEKFDSRILTC